ncbi:MAG: hypothetical protein AABX05_03875, partial [Nanoarchaeota archaeon]
MRKMFADRLLLILLILLVLIVSSCDAVKNFAGEAVRNPVGIRPGTSTLQPAPQVYNTKFFQSPVRAEPDDLLNIQGDGLKEGAIVVYRQITDKPSSLSAPVIIPSVNNALEG